MFGCPAPHLCLGNLPHLHCGGKRQSSGQSGNFRQSQPSLPTPGMRTPSWAPPVTPALDMKSGAWSWLVLSDSGGWDGWALGCTALTHLEKECLIPLFPRCREDIQQTKSLWERNHRPRSCPAFGCSCTFCLISQRCKTWPLTPIGTAMEGQPSPQLPWGRLSPLLGLFPSSASPLPNSAFFPCSLTSALLLSSASESAPHIPSSAALVGLEA